MKDWVWNWTFWELIFYSSILNLLIFVACIYTGRIFQKFFQKNKAYELMAENFSKIEIVFSISTVLINTIILLLGWVLWKNHFIKIKTDDSMPIIVFDALVLFLSMDVCMYFFHRIAHNPFIFNLVHTTHHEFKNPKPVTLFVLNPFETIGFGVLWLILLCLYSSSWYGMIFYLNLNTLFGLIGHLGVEPFPSNWVRIPILSKITTGTFHILHHQNLDYNFGFYTTIWDELFNTTHPEYKSRFEEIA
ncbi:MAG TPA: sterol desaturase family protein [Leptospiraceae bacterium]|nr:sterol desaturase family protein [Leptospiraceae bacterium]HMW04182.1 sterol desaturase family protein [Leptospiraceae bacterium]HMX32714.1 sterol desaturase family protein [Leptospiraceae bacterium]HMY30175.1 sterol desaturase family protein [Leptospiraceae bacterium]HMZ65158.1 sterol desaturase family protein [Leptospiraceae bacterium]